MKEKGTTLVELLLVMALMGMFLVILTDMLVISLDIQTESKAVASTEHDGRFILARLSYDIGRASSVTTPAVLGGSGSTLVLVISGVTNTYTISGNTLQLNNDQGTDALNGLDTSVSAFSVQRLGNIGGKDTIRFSFTITSVAADDQGQRSQTYNSAVGLR